MDEIDLLISDDLDKIASLEAELIDVVTALEDLSVQEGVCRSNMASFEAYLPEDYPLTSFTRRPTQTNLEVATVTLENRQGAILTAIAVAVGMLIGRLISWFIEKYRNYRNLKAANDAAERIRKMNETLSKKREELGGNLDLVSLVKKHSPKALELEERFKELFNEYSEACLHGDAFVSEVFSIQESVYGDLLPKILEYGDYYKRLAKEDSDPIGLVSEVSTASRYFETKAQQLHKSFEQSRWRAISGPPNSFNALVRAIKSKADAMRNAPSKRSMTLADFADEVGVRGSDFESSSIARLPNYHFRFEDAYVKRYMREMGKLEKDLKAKQSIRSSEPLFISGMKSFLLTLQNEISAIIQYGHILDQMEETETKLFELAAQYREEQNRSLDLEKKARD